MSEKSEIAKKLLKKVIMAAVKPLLIAALIIGVVGVIVSAFLNAIIMHEGTVQDGDKSNVPYASAQYSSNINIDADGKVTTNISVQELWDELIEEDSCINQYLDKPEELKKLLDAELITDFLDTRPNPDDPIDWDKLNKDVDSKEIQGIVKLKRAMDDGSTITMVYTDPETFQSNIDKYNASGSEADKETALRYFTIESGYTSSLSYGTGETSSEESMVWPTEGNKITSEFGTRTDPITGAKGTTHNGVDISVPTGTNVYAAEAGTVTTAGFNTSAGNWVIIDHGNGYITKYMHNSELKVSKGDKVEKGQVISLSGNTGDSTGPHLHFQIEYNGTPINPLNFKYENGMGSGAGGIGSDPDTLSMTSQFYAKVATWTETTDIITSTDPDVQESTTFTHTMTSTRVNYQDFLSGYKMPFLYLWNFLQIGQVKGFVLDLADLVYGSEIEITVHDNFTETTNINTDTYTRKTKVITDDVKVGVEYQSTSFDSWDTAHEYPYTSTGRTTKNNAEPLEAEEQKTYSVVHTVITKSNTLDISLTKANVWIVDYTKDYTYQTPDSTNTVTNSPQDDVPYPNTPDKTDNVDAMGLAEEFRKGIQSAYEENYYNVNTTVNSLKSEYYYSTVNRNININDTVKTTKYVSSPANIKEKTDSKSTEPNFVTIYLKKEYYENAVNIDSATQWLFDLLNRNAEDMVDLTKYLLYKATGHDYGKTEFDFSIFEPENFVKVGQLYGNTVEEKVWFALKDAGFSEYAVAGAMGNIYGESGFDPAVIEKSNGVGFGLCQWSFGRRTQLESYASSKGKEPSDVDTQIEFLITELTPGAAGPAQGYATYQLVNYNGYNGDDWKNASSPEDAATAFCWAFERPNNAANVTTRQNKAREYYNQFHGKTAQTLGDIDESVKTVLEDVMKNWSSNMESGRQTVIQKAASLIGKGCHYSQPNRSPAEANPKYLDCSSYVTWAFTQCGYRDIPVTAYTGTYVTSPSLFGGINAGELIPGDVGLNNTGTAGGNSNHIGLYIGKNSKGQNVWLHCTSSGINGPQVGVGNIGFKVFYRYRNW